MSNKAMPLTREDLVQGRELLRVAFAEPWRYRQFEIECGACRAHEQGQEGDGVPECSNPECTGEVPCTFVEAPEQYPGESDEYEAQVVATIEVPGLSCLAQKNGEAICWLRNNAPTLLDSMELLLDLRDAVEFITEHERHEGHPPTVTGLADLVPYAKSLGWKRP